MLTYDVQEEDFSHIIGLGLLMWVFLISFILLSAAIGKRPCQPSASMLAVCTACTPRHPSCTFIDICFGSFLSQFYFALQVSVFHALTWLWLPKDGAFGSSQ